MGCEKDMQSAASGRPELAESSARNDSTRTGTRTSFSLTTITTNPTYPGNTLAPFGHVPTERTRDVASIQQVAINRDFPSSDGFDFEFGAGQWSYIYSAAEMLL
jgi:hypothetical protein